MWYVFSEQNFLFSVSQFIFPRSIGYENGSKIFAAEGALHKKPESNNIPHEAISSVHEERIPPYEEKSIHISLASDKTK